MTLRPVASLDLHGGLAVDVGAAEDLRRGGRVADLDGSVADVDAAGVGGACGAAGAAWFTGDSVRRVGVAGAVLARGSIFLRTSPRTAALTNGFVQGRHLAL